MKSRRYASKAFESDDHVVVKIPRSASAYLQPEFSTDDPKNRLARHLMAAAPMNQKVLLRLGSGVDGMNEKTQDREVLERICAPGPDVSVRGDAFADAASCGRVRFHPDSRSTRSSGAD
jgi:carbamoyl-phosphate synthase large subunit